MALNLAGIISIVGAESKAEPGLAFYLDGNSLRQMLSDSDVTQFSGQIDARLRAPTPA